MNQGQLSFKGVNASGQPTPMSSKDAIDSGMVCSLPLELKKHEEECRAK